MVTVFIAFTKQAEQFQTTGSFPYLLNLLVSTFIGLCNIGQPVTRHDHLTSKSNGSQD